MKILFWYILLIFLMIIFKKYLRNENNDKRAVLFVSIVLIIFCAPFVYSAISIKSPFGFIVPEQYDAWIGFYGSIIGGVLTVLGVWWTIDDNNKKKQEELSIQYRPILRLQANNSNIRIQDYHGKKCLITKLINVGRGEALDCKVNFVGKVNQPKPIPFIPNNDIVDFPIPLPNETDVSTTIEITFEYKDLNRRNTYLTAVTIFLKYIGDIVNSIECATTISLIEKPNNEKDTKMEFDEIMSIDFENKTEKELVIEQIMKLNKLKQANIVITILIFILIFICVINNSIYEKYSLFISFICGTLFSIAVQRYSNFEMKIIDLQRDYAILNRNEDTQKEEL